MSDKQHACLFLFFLTNSNQKSSNTDFPMRTPLPFFKLKPCFILKKWHLIQNHPSLWQIFKELPLIYFKRGKSLKGMLLKSEALKRSMNENTVQESKLLRSNVWACQTLLLPTVTWKVTSTNVSYIVMPCTCIVSRFLQ